MNSTLWYNGCSVGTSGVPRVVRAKLVLLALAILEGCGPARPTLSLKDAVARGAVGQVESHIYWGVDVDAEGKSGETALHDAASYCHPEIARLLLRAGASPHSRAKNGDTPLHAAAQYGCLEVARLLIDAHADVDAVAGKYRETPLHYCAGAGSLVRAMIGAHLKTHPHDSPSMQYGAVALLLIDSGASINAVNTPYGETALDVTVDPDVKSTLESKGAVRGRRVRKSAGSATQ